MRHLIPAALLLTSLAVQAVTEDLRKTTVAILMFDGVQIIDFAAPYEVFGRADLTVYTVWRWTQLKEEKR